MLTKMRRLTCTQCGATLHAEGNRPMVCPYCRTEYLTGDWGAQAPEGTAEEVGTAGWDLEVIRRLLSAAFNDGELMTLCFDRFPEVYDGFGSGMPKSEKIRALVDHCRQRGQVEELLQAIEAYNPFQYRKFSGKLAAPGTGE